jgi:hypothetical protein
MTQQQSYWDQPNVACMPCRGRGWIIQEDPSGAPSTQVVCPYCHGRQTTWWVAPNRQKRIIRPRIKWVFLLLCVVFSLLPSNYFFINVMGWLMDALCVLVWLKPRLWPTLPRRQHAPGFTDHREKVSLGIFAAVVGIRSLFGNHQQRGF